MLEMVEARRDGDKEERYDLFSGLLDASRDESDNEAALSDEELIGKYQTVSHTLDSCLLAIPGNMFIYLLAGHEAGLGPSLLWRCGL